MRAFDTIFRLLGWAFDDTGLPGGEGGGGGGSLIVVKPGGRQLNLNEMAMSLQGDWNETSSLTRGSFEHHFLCHDG